MRKILILLALCSVSLFSQTVISGRISSSAYSFQRYDNDTLKTAETYIRGYQQAQVMVGYDKFSLHTSFNFENSYKNSLESDSRLHFYNLYLEGSNLLNCATVKIGRQPIYSGVGAGVFDGIGAKVTGYNLIAEGYFGANVPAYQELKLIDNWQDNSLTAARLRYLPLEGLTIAAGYVDKRFKPQDYLASRLDDNMNPIQILIQNRSAEYQYLNGEVSYEQENERRFFRTKYEYDLNFQQTSKVELEGESGIGEKLDVVVYGLYREPKIRYNSIFSVFDYGNTKEVEAGLSYHFCSDMIVSGRYGYTDYKDENSSRANISLSTKYGTLNFRKTFGDAGELNSISFSTGYTFFEGLLTPSAAVSYTDYKLTKDDPTDKLTTVLLGVNVRPYKSFSFDVQGQYLDNRIYQNDVRLLVKLNYWFHSLL